MAGALRYAHAHGLDGYVQYLLGVRARVRLERCEWDDALADAAESLGHAGAQWRPRWSPWAGSCRSRGDAEALSRLDEAAGYAYDTGELPRICPVAAARAEYFLLAGEPARAEAEARAGLVLAHSKSQLWFSGELAYRLWQATGVAASGPSRALPADAAARRLAGGGGAFRPARARLLAERLTYLDIAERLALSPRTVEHHVSAVLGKLRVATRGQAVAVAHRMHLID